MNWQSEWMAALHKEYGYLLEQPFSPLFEEPEDLESSDDDESFIPLLVESEPEWEPDSEEDD